MIWLAGWLGVGGAEVLEQAKSTAQVDLEAALAELAKVREEIEAERVPLARSLHDLEQQVLDRRRDVERAERLNENSLVLLNSERSRAKARADELKFLESLLGEYLRVFETRMHIAEVDRWAPQVTAAKEAMAAVGQEGTVRVERQAQLMALGLGRVEELLGGMRFEGRALVPSGRMESGTFLLLGPAGYFQSGDSEVGGLAELQLGSPGPTVVGLEKDAVAAIREVAGGSGQGRLPVDVTGGNALKLAQTRDSWWVHVRKGGPVMMPILTLAVFSLVVFALKWVQLGRIRIARPMDLQGILQDLKRGDTPGAEAKARGVAGPVGAMLVRAVEHAREPKEYIEEVMYEEMLQTKPRLETWLPFLALAAAAAPLLGLLGTVTGMINTFNMITVFGTGDPKTLAGGISEALITTEYGLIVAIPALLLHSVLSRRVKGVLGSMEQTTVAFINGLEVPATGEGGHAASVG